MPDKFLDKKLDKLIRWFRFHQVIRLVPDNCIVCDIGCGLDCLFLETIDHKLVKGIGIDQDVDKGIEQKNPKIKVYQADVQKNLPLESASIDVVTMMALIEHILDYDSALQEIYRILKPGGRLILTTPTPAAKLVLEFMAFKLHIIAEDEIKDHKQYFSAILLKGALSKAGFQAIKTKHFELGFNLLGLAQK